MSAGTSHILVVGGDPGIADEVAIFERRGDHLQACPAPAINGTNRCIDEWLSNTSSPQYAAVFCQGEGSDQAAEHLRKHAVTVERFNDRQSLMDALDRFKQ